MYMYLPNTDKLWTTRIIVIVLIIKVPRTSGLRMPLTLISTAGDENHCLINGLFYVLGYKFEFVQNQRCLEH